MIVILFSFKIYEWVNKIITIIFKDNNFVIDTLYFNEKATLQFFLLSLFFEMRKKKKKNQLINL